MIASPSFVTRFAPSPTGRMHLGNLFSALCVEDAAKRAGGRVWLRIEDIDVGRCKPEFETLIRDDLTWVGFRWDGPVRRQSEHMADYAGALARLEALEVTYPCFCTRRDIAAEILRSASAPHGPDGALYPGTCRRLDPAERAARLRDGVPHAIRLDMEKAAAIAGPLHWHEAGRPPIACEPLLNGDVVVARKDIATSYHLAVCVDDHLQGVTDVIRGEDLFHVTHVHRVIQALLGYEPPRYRHHRLLRDAFGQRLAKRQDPTSLEELRRQGHTPAALRRELGFAD